MHGLTDFADQAVIIPMALLSTMAFIIVGWWRAALAWAFVVPAALLSILAGKLFVLGCGGFEPYGWALHSPSGHTASASLICGGLSGLMIPTRRRMSIAMLFAVASAAVIGGSRLVLQAHTLADVVIGAAIGIFATFILVWQAGAPPGRLPYLPAIAAALASGAMVFHGAHLPAESWIIQNALPFWPTAECVLVP